MNFFNRYKDLFEIPQVRMHNTQGLPVPTSRLRLDNELFIQKTYLNTKTQEYSLNSKLRDLKKDYNQLEHHIVEVEKMRSTPRRSFSRKGSAKQQSSVQMLPSPKPNNQNKAQKQHRPKPFEYDRTVLEEDRRKRDGWWDADKSNILKHSQLDHIFNNKLNNIYDLDEVHGPNVPKPPPPPQNESIVNHMKPKREQFMIKQRSRPNINQKGGGKAQNNNSSNVQGAVGRREKAKNNLQFRRKKLEQLLKTLW